jgi:hypothetical protein
MATKKKPTKKVVKKNAGPKKLTKRTYVRKPKTAPVEEVAVAAEVEDQRIRDNDVPPQAPEEVNFSGYTTGRIYTPMSKNDIARDNLRGAFQFALDANYDMRANGDPRKEGLLRARLNLAVEQFDMAVNDLESALTSR